MKLLLSALSGAAGWTLAEYRIHRHLGHDPKLHPNPFSKEHRRHHATTHYFAPTSSKLLAAAGAVAVMAPATATLIGVRGGAAFGLGFATAYLGYEIMHRLAHVRPPTTSYGRWLRRHHFHHHFHNPKRNHGVTSPLWDYVFGTYEPPGVVRVPARHAMEWLVERSGQRVRAEYASDYELAPARRRPGTGGSTPRRTSPSPRPRSASSALPPGCTPLVSCR